MVNYKEREEEEHSGLTDGTVRKLRESVQCKMNLPRLSSVPTSRREAGHGAVASLPFIFSPRRSCPGGVRLQEPQVEEVPRGGARSVVQGVPVIARLRVGLPGAAGEACDTRRS